MKNDKALLSDFEHLNRLLERLAVDLYGFVRICGVGEDFRAEQITIDALSRAVERGDLDDMDLEALYLRERILTEVWQSFLHNIGPMQDPSFERFYSLPQKTRAAIYLRHRIGLTFISIERILSLTEGEVRGLILTAREHLVGRPLSKIDWGF